MGKAWSWTKDKLGDAGRGIGGALGIGKAGQEFDANRSIERAEAMSEYGAANVDPHFQAAQDRYGQASDIAGGLYRSGKQDYRNNANASSFALSGMTSLSDQMAASGQQYGSQIGQMGQQTYGDLRGAAADAMSGPYASEAALRQGLGQIQRQNLAAAAGGRGNAAASMRNAMSANADQAMMTNQSAAIARAQEEQGRRQLQGQLLGQAGQIGGALAAQAGQTTQQGLGAAADTRSAQAAGYGNLAALGAGRESLGFNAQQQAIGAQAGIDEQRAQTELGYLQGGTNAAAQTSQSGRNSIGSLIQTGGQATGMLAMLSDVTTKEDIQDAEEPVKQLFRQLSPATYTYKDEYKGTLAPEGKHLGVMAQDLQKHEIGRAAVRPDPQSGRLSVDYGRLMPTAMAGIASLQKQLDEITAKKKEKK